MPYALAKKDTIRLIYFVIFIMKFLIYSLVKAFEIEISSKKITAGQVNTNVSAENLIVTRENTFVSLENGDVSMENAHAIPKNGDVRWKNAIASLENGTVSPKIQFVIKY